jgi:hypothetical protein
MPEPSDAARRVARETFERWRTDPDNSWITLRDVFADALDTFAAKAVARERERCAAYLEQLAETHPHAASLYRHAAYNLRAQTEETGDIPDRLATMPGVRRLRPRRTYHVRAPRMR